jgi:hypothetical protein
VPVFALLLTGFLAAAVALALIPETAEPRSGALASLQPRAQVPHQARTAFVAALPGLVAVFALGGLYLAIATSLAVGVLHTTNHLNAPRCGGRRDRPHRERPAWDGDCHRCRWMAGHRAHP